ncbi:MAG: PD-(D/E)XK nuclease family transposase [Pirellulaceae bacterium]|nr:PD-(D/E)XK nuclease family transposase [Pirellulaceae bacterium]
MLRSRVQQWNRRIHSWISKMPLRIDPRVDFASKKMLGSPEHPVVTIHFLNSILKLRDLIVDVIILNPLIGKERAEDKIVVLDILAKDSIGRLFNIEYKLACRYVFPTGFSTTTAEITGSSCIKATDIPSSGPPSVSAS